MKRFKCSEEEEEEDNHGKEARIKDGWELQLPELVIIGILSRLPIATIFRCRCVCKIFNKILKDPYFARVHLTKASNMNRCLIIKNTDRSSKFHFIDMIDLDEKQNKPWKTLTMPATLSEESQPKVVLSTVLCSCNGLMFMCYLLRGDPSQIICVCNPILGEFMVLPPPPSKFEPSYSLGFCLKTKKYKVVHFTTSLFTEIHTLGTNCWRKIDLVPHPARALICLECSLLNNASTLPFLTERYKEASHMICSFNFETEQCLYLPPPTHFFVEDFCEKLYYVEVGLSGGSLCIYYSLDKYGPLEVWVMNKYGVSDSWTKKFTIDIMMLNCMSRNPMFSSFNFQQIRFIRLLNNEDIVISYFQFQVLYYSHRKGTISDILDLSREGNENARIKGQLNALEIVPSFISLRDIIGGASVEVLQIGKTNNPLN